MGWRWPKLADQRGSAGYAAARVVNEGSNGTGKSDRDRAEGRKHPACRGKLFFRDIGSAHVIPVGSQAIDLVCILGATHCFTNFSHSTCRDSDLVVKRCHCLRIARH